MSAPIITADRISFDVHKGQTLELATQALSPEQQQILQTIQRQQCLDISSSQPFNLQNGTVHFNDFKFKKLPESDSKCRKLKPRSGVRVRPTH